MVPLGMLLLVVPLMWFPWRWPWLTLAALPILPLALAWSCRIQSRQKVWIGHGLPLVLVALLLATCVATLPITDWRVGLVKVLGMALGVSIVYVLLNGVRCQKSLKCGVALMAATALLLVGSGLVGADWSGGKLSLLDPISRAVSTPLRSLMPSLPGGRINGNELAGALVLLVPVLLCQAYAICQSGNPATSRSFFKAIVRWPVPYAWLVVVIGWLGVLMVLATQSRGGIAAIGFQLAGLGGFVVHRVLAKRYAPWLVQAVTLAVYTGSVFLAAWGGWQLLSRWSGGRSVVSIEHTLEARLGLWKSTGYMLEDFPFTGVGLGQFSDMLHAQYPTFTIPYGEPGPHPHNLLLAYAVELGLPGALAFGVLVLLFFGLCARAAGSSVPQLRWTGVGLALGLLGFLIFGLTDAIAPGARGSLPLWLIIGLGAAVGHMAHQVRTTPALPKSK